MSIETVYTQPSVAGLPPQTIPAPSPVQTVPPPSITVPPPTVPHSAVLPVETAEDSKKRKAVEGVANEVPSKIAKTNSDDSVNTSVNATDQQPGVYPVYSEWKCVFEYLPPATYEYTIEWPEDAFLSKEEDLSFYDRVVLNGVEYKLEDNCELWPDDSGAPGFIGTIKSLYTDGTDNSVECCWFYRIEETIFKTNSRHQTGPREVFVSDHVDDNALESVRKKVTVLPFSEVSDVAEFITKDDSYYYKRKYNHRAKCFERL